MAARAEREAGREANGAVLCTLRDAKAERQRASNRELVGQRNAEVGLARFDNIIAHHPVRVSEWTWNKRSGRRYSRGRNGLDGDASGKENKGVKVGRKHGVNEEVCL